MDYLLISSVNLLLEVYFLIALRLIGFFLVVPVFGGTGTNVLAKVSLSLTSAFIILNSQMVEVKTYSTSIPIFLLIGIKELGVGIVIGFTIYMLFTMFYYVGQLVDWQIGFSMVSVFDPINQIQIPITGNLFYLCVSYLFILTEAHYNFFRALFYSYMLIPIGESILAGEDMIRTVTSMYGNFFAMGFKTALPIIGTMLVIELSLGVLNKASPQMHIFSVGMSAKVLLGLGLIYITLPVFVTIAEGVFTYINQVIYTIMGGMAP